MGIIVDNPAPQKDKIDIILTNPLQAIEVKYRKQPSPETIKKFRQKFKTCRATIITKETEKTEQEIKFTPFWKWLLENETN